MYWSILFNVVVAMYRHTTISFIAVKSVRYNVITDWNVQIQFHLSVTYTFVLSIYG
jgi:hypothetical protein